MIHSFYYRYGCFSVFKYAGVEEFRVSKQKLYSFLIGITTPGEKEWIVEKKVIDEPHHSWNQQNSRIIFCLGKFKGEKLEEMKKNKESFASHSKLSFILIQTGSKNNNK